MSSSLALSALKEDIKLLERLYSKKSNSNKNSATSIDLPTCSSKLEDQSISNNCFRIISASIDELVCELIDKNKKKYRINANICETYPQSPPVWFSGK
jgi:hypothetical protein